MGGTVTDAANTLGMALETGRVRGLGFSKELTTEISLLASHGQTAQMDTIILDNLTAKYSGQAATALDTYAGKQANYAWFKRTRRRPEQFAELAADIS